jgi:hypothetical protein
MEFIEHRSQVWPLDDNWEPIVPDWMTFGVEDDMKTFCPCKPILLEDPWLASATFEKGDVVMQIEDQDHVVKCKTPPDQIRILWIHFQGAENRDVLVPHVDIGTIGRATLDIGTLGSFHVRGVEGEEEGDANAHCYLFFKAQKHYLRLHFVGLDRARAFVGRFGPMLDEMATMTKRKLYPKVRTAGPGLDLVKIKKDDNGVTLVEDDGGYQVEVSHRQFPDAVPAAPPIVKQLAEAEIPPATVPAPPASEEVPAVAIDVESRLE